MRKVFSLFMLFIALITLVGCFESDTTLEFVDLPDSVYYLGQGGTAGQIDLTKVIIKLNGTQMSVQKAIDDFGATVTGYQYTTNGYHSLLIKYESATISFSYFVDDGTPGVEKSYEIDWYVGQSSPYSISSLGDLKGLAEVVNGTAKDDSNNAIAVDTFAGKVVNLTADIDMGDEGWTPIGQGRRKQPVAAPGTGEEYTGHGQQVREWTHFDGTFDGLDHTITGLTDVGYTPSVAGDYFKDGGIPIADGYVYGLFGITFNASIKNLRMDDVAIYGITSIDLETGNYVVYNGDSVSAIVGYACGSFEMDDCQVLDGTIVAADSVGGVLGRAYENTSFSLTNCVNRANVTATLNVNVKLGGICGLISATAVTGSSYAGYVIQNNKNYGTVTISNNFNTGGAYIGGITASNSLPGAVVYDLDENNENFGSLVYNSELLKNATKLTGSTISIKVCDDKHCVTPGCTDVNHHSHTWWN